MMNKMMNITKSTCAIHAAVPAIPVKPNMAAIIATIKNVIAQPNICPFFFTAYTPTLTLLLISNVNLRHSCF